MKLHTRDTGECDRWIFELRFQVLVLNLEFWLRILSLDLKYSVFSRFWVFYFILSFVFAVLILFCFFFCFAFQFWVEAFWFNLVIWFRFLSFKLFLSVNGICLFWHLNGIWGEGGYHLRSQKLQTAWLWNFYHLLVLT